MVCFSNRSGYLVYVVKAETALTGYSVCRYLLSTLLYQYYYVFQLAVLTDHLGDT